ncbi:hypothetical protein DZF91_15645 [Actinomadura logoneensis]|uniref:Phospholipid carrier-dependent glycosyltransferase n=1 Tax=Actinomadura logoneensis TaxID=2293572 RepID=A0A372JL20_9ACTN|nr:hypothetical protein [Actinomadura logoneensis]RFU40717.1 hypothetical protein DZF91_15645 [Actinomadura logoneensis]
MTELTVREEVPDTGATGPPRTRAARSREFARAHWVFLTLLSAGAVLRGTAMLGYRWVMWFPDSNDYLSGAVNPNPNLVRPSGYSLFLWLVKPLHSLAAVSLLQHLMGLAVAVMVYALARRAGVARGLAALATAPVLLDANQVQLEHMLMSDTLFGFLVTAAVVVLLLPAAGRRGLALAAAGGLLLGLATVTRSAGLPLLAVAAFVLLVRRAGWRPLVAMAAAGVIPVVAYSSWFAADRGEFTMTRSTGVFLYGRVAPFADCRKMDVPVEQMALCLSSDPRDRSVRESYIWGPRAPRYRVEGTGFTPEGERLAFDFAVRAITHQPVDYAKVALTDLGRTFRWDHPAFPDRTTYAHYLFGRRTFNPDRQAEAYVRAYDPGYAPTRATGPYASLLGAYQKVAYLPGTVLGVIMVGGLALMVRLRRWDGLLPWTIGVVLLVVPALTAQFDYRYVLPAAPLMCLAAVLAARPPAPGETGTRTRLPGRTGRLLASRA